MKLYTCSNCHSLIYFENNICLNCKYSLGFDAQTLSLITLIAEGNNIFTNAQNTGIVRIQNIQHATGWSLRLRTLPTARPVI